MTACPKCTDLKMKKTSVLPLCGDLTLNSYRLSLKTQGHGESASRGMSANWWRVGRRRLTYIFLMMISLCSAWSTLSSAHADGLTIDEEYKAPPQAFTARDYGVWFGLYTTYWFNKKWGYYGEYHVRRADLLNRMSKLYIRMGANYKVDDHLRLTFGVVNRYTWSDFPDSPEEEKYVPEFRFWEQLLFNAHYFGLKLYHQLRVEQRWRRSTKIIDPKYYYYNRFRYKFLIYGPLYGELLSKGSVYFCLYNEIFMQQGEKVKFNYFEDNRSYVGIAYGLSDNFHLHFGYMKSFGQLDEFTFRNHDIFRLSLYHKHSFFDGDSH